MNKLLLSAAITAALFAGQAQAVVLNAAGTPDTTATGIFAGTVDEIWISGSSAATPFVEKSVIADCTTTGTIYKYSNGTADFTWICDSSLTAGTVNVVHKRDGGGSVTGINSALGNNPLYATTASLNAATCAAPVSGVSACTITTPVNVAHAGDLNLADVDAAQFEDPINGGITAASTLNNKAVATQIFGIVVNTKLRNAMQVAQVAAGSMPGTCAAGNETEACVPSLTTAQISAIFGANRVTSWGNLRFDNPAVAQTVTQSLFGAQTAANQPGNQDIHICTRTTGSGSLAIEQLKFENSPCFAGEPVATKAAQTITAETGGSGATKIVHSMSGSGDLENCLIGLNQGTAQGTFAPYPTVLNSTGNTNSFRWAIGYMSLDRNAAQTKDYRFIKIDGVAPTGVNVVNGKYRFWGELVAVDNGTTTTDALALDILANLGSASQITALNVHNLNFTNASYADADVTGFLGTATNTLFLPTSGTVIAPGTLINAAFDSLRPVNPWTHEQAAGGGLNHCRVPSIPKGASKIMPALD